MAHRGTHPTDAGMHALWSPHAFAAVHDYDTWARELLDDTDIERNIRAGHFVPLNIESDGAMEIEVRTGGAGSRAELTPREEKYLIVRSQPYRFVSAGSFGVSGIEAVTGEPGADVGTADLPAGEYEVTVHLIAWDEEPAMKTPTGPAPGALPDYVVLVNPATDPAPAYRTAVTSFDGGS